MSQTEEKREGFYLSEDGEWIPDGWEYKLIGEEVCLAQGVAINKKTDFILCDESEGVPLLKINNLLNNTVDHYVNPLLVTEKAILKKEDIIFTRTGQPGWVFKNKNGVLHNNSFKVIPSDKLDSNYLYWFLKQKQIFNYIQKVASGSAQPDLSHDTFKTVPIFLPPLPEQKAIASVLGSLDDKIELLREQNETLEALAQTLFKRWFIDFNFPDENGNPYKDSGGEIVASELGEIPEGWKVAELQEIITLKKSAIRSDAISHEEKYVGLEHISRKHLQLTEHGWGKDVSSNKSKFSRGDILFGKLRPYFHKVCIAPFEGICSTDILVLNVVTELWYSFSLMHIYSERLIDFVTLASTGTRMPRTSFSEIGRYKIPLPPQRVAKPFDEMCRKFFEKASDNTEQIETLTQLRDTLLPKLMKGEVRVPIEP